MARASMPRTPTKLLRIIPRITPRISINNSSSRSHISNISSINNNNNNNNNRASMDKALEEEEMSTKIKTIRNRLGNNSGTA